jgi:hypothetical protein
MGVGVHRGNIFKLWCATFRGRSELETFEKNMSASAAIYLVALVCGIRVAGL